MKHLTIGIPDKLYNSFLELFKHIPEITIAEDSEIEIPEAHKKLVRQRMKNAKPENFKSYSEVQKKIKKKYAL